MSVLILHKLKETEKYDEWLESIDKLYLFTTRDSALDSSKYTCVREFDNYTLNGMLEVEAVELGKHISLQHVLSFYEDDILRAARIREALGVTGQNIKSALAYRDKVVMKNYIREAGLPCPDYSEIFSPLDVTKFIHQYGYPVVIKPVDGMGSQETYIISNDKEMNNILAHGFRTRFMIERFVEGQMYSSNGVMVNNEIVFCSVNRYSNGGVFFRGNEGFLAELVGTNEEIFGIIKNFTREVILALPSPETVVFHCEVFVKEGGDILFCEIASRPGGGAICEMIEYSYGMNLNEFSSKLLCGVLVDIPNETPTVLSAYYKIPKKQGKLISIIEDFPFPWVKLFISNMKEASEFESAESCADVLGTAVFIGKDKNELREHFQMLKKYIDQNLIWEEKGE